MISFSIMNDVAAAHGAAAAGNVAVSQHLA
jgi:hypothetical protein